MYSLPWSGLMANLQAAPCFFLPREEQLCLCLCVWEGCVAGGAASWGQWDLRNEPLLIPSPSLDLGHDPQCLLSWDGGGLRGGA